MRILNLLLCFVIALLFVGCLKEENSYSTTIIHQPNLKADMVYQVGVLIEGTGRQPEMAATLTAEFDEKLFSSYTEVLPVSSENEVMMGQSLGYVVGKLLEGCARQPEIAPMLIEKAEKYIGNYSMGLYTETMIQFMTPQAVGKYIEGCARQPEMAPMLEEVMQNFIGL